MPNAPAPRTLTLVMEGVNAAGARASLPGMLFRPTWRFLHNYVLRLGFLDGRAGYVLAKVYAHYTFMKYAQLWERARAAREGERR